MQQLILCFIGYVAYLVLNSIIFIIDVAVGGGGSGKIFDKFWLLSIILAGIIILVGTSRYFLMILPKLNKIISILISIVASSIQLVILEFIFFAFSSIILAPILSRFGFHVTMP